MEVDLVFARKRTNSRVATPKRLDKQVLKDLFFVNIVIGGTSPVLVCCWFKAIYQEQSSRIV